jgi:hypothetical protein
MRLDTGGVGSIALHGITPQEAEEAVTVLYIEHLANRKGLPYQTYIKMVLHEALRKERRSA